jgi:hypothetical protein
MGIPCLLKVLATSGIFPEKSRLWNVKKNWWSLKVIEI